VFHERRERRASCFVRRASSLMGGPPICPRLALVSKGPTILSPLGGIKRMAARRETLGATPVCVWAVSARPDSHSQAVYWQWGYNTAARTLAAHSIHSQPARALKGERRVSRWGTTVGAEWCLLRRKLSTTGTRCTLGGVSETAASGRQQSQAYMPYMVYRT
jgi:hypothetical protein